MQITGYGYHHKHGYSAKKASDKGQKRAFRPLRRKSNSPFQELKSDAQTNLRMLHDILFFYVVVANFTVSKNEFKILVCPKCAQILVFHPKIRAEKASWKAPRSLDFTGREGGIRTHGGSSPHLISSLLFCFLEHRHFAELLVYKGNSFFVWLDMTSSNHRI